MGCILGTTIGSYLFFLSLLGLLDPCFAIGGFLVRVAKMLFVDIIGPWAYILNFFSRTRTGFNLESFLNRVFSWIIGSIVIDKVLKNLDLLEILAPIEPPGMTSISKEIVEMEKKKVAHIHSFAHPIEPEISILDVDEKNQSLPTALPHRILQVVNENCSLRLGNENR